MATSSKRGFGLARPGEKPDNENKRSKLDSSLISIAIVQRVLDELVRLQACYDIDVDDSSAFSEAEFYHVSFRQCFSHVGKKKIKHCKQHSALVQSLERTTGALDFKSRPVFVELGCGSAALSKHFNVISQGHARHVLIDRLTFRGCNKRDNDIQRFARDNGHDTSLLRLTQDLSNVDADELHTQAATFFEDPALRFNFVSKHLCGPATDFGLTIVQNTCSRTKTVAIATCCHYLCEPETLTYRQNTRLSDDDLRVIAQCSQWCSMSQNVRGKIAIDPTATSLAELSREQKAAFGRECKMLLDLTRLSGFSKQGWKATLKRFVHESITTDNRVLILTPKM